MFMNYDVPTYLLPFSLDVAAEISTVHLDLVTNICHRTGCCCSSTG